MGRNLEMKTGIRLGRKKSKSRLAQNGSKQIAIMLMVSERGSHFRN